MIRRATDADLPRISEIRNGVRENRLSDPSRVTIEDVKWFIANPGIFVWEEAGTIAGFSAADPRNASIWALFVEEQFEGRGIGSALLAEACAVLAGHRLARIWLTTEPGSRAEGFYRRAGWEIVGERDGDLLLEKGI